MSKDNKVQLHIDEILPHIYWVHKPVSRALDSSNGLLICTPTEAITIDVNIPEPELNKMYEFIGNLPHSVHVNTHLHLDHITHLHLYQEKGPCKIYVPAPDAVYFHKIEGHRKDYGYDAAGLADTWMNLVYQEFHFQPVQSFQPFSVSESLKIGELELRPILFKGHGPGHVGFHGICQPSPHFPQGKNQFLFYSDIGIDLGAQEFGPWYGFKSLNLKDVRSDLEHAERLHKSLNIPMVSSHGLVYSQYSQEPYDYVRKKLLNREEKIVQVIKILGGKATVQQILPYDIFYPKSKMKGNIKLLVTYWEEGFILNHLLEMVSLGKVKKENDIFSLI